MPAAKGASPRKETAIKEPLTKAQLLATLAENTGLTKKDVTGVLDELSLVINRHLKKRGAGQFTMPGLMKIKTVRRPATKARKGTNPFTGQETVFKAKPARTVVKVQPLKGLKDMVD
jgi:nucleoid DNA-binding protein